MSFSICDSGQSVEGQPIKAFSNTPNAKEYIYLMGGVHGDEVEGVYVLDKLFKWLKKEKELKLPLIIIPILNVDGYRNSKRVNSRGVDLNRNLPTKDFKSDYDEEKNNPGTTPLSEPENVFFKKLLDKYSPSLIITFHSWKPILNYNGHCKDVADFLSELNNYPVVGDIGYPTPGSLGTYAVEAYDCPVLTFECPTLKSKKTLEQIWDENKKGLKKLFADDLIKKKLKKQ